jgi:hypothetical protein
LAIRAALEELEISTGPGQEYKHEVGGGERLGNLGTGGYWSGFPVTAALRYLLVLARRFRSEGLGFRAAIHANPDLLGTVRALVIVCAVHAPNITSYSQEAL